MQAVGLGREELSLQEEGGAALGLTLVGDVDGPEEEVGWLAEVFLLELIAESCVL